MNSKFSLICYIVIISLLGCKENNSSGAEKNMSGMNKTEKSTEFYTNPVIDKNFPDPAIIKGHDGYYYAYGTNTSIDNKNLNIQVVKSKDLIHWGKPIDAMPDPPTWADKDFWAPHVLYDETGKTYYLYYSGESKNNDLGKCLGVATSKSPTGPFTDKDAPLLCGEGFINIDPMAFDDPVTGRKLLYWGSGFESIKVRELTDDRLNFKEGTTAKNLIKPIANSDPSNYQRLVEGAWVNKRGDYYYLYFSVDNCCGENAHYAAMVARSKNASGPFETLAESGQQDNSVILQHNKRWNTLEHNSVSTDNPGDDFLVYHPMDKKRRNEGRVMLINKIEYKDN